MYLDGLIQVAGIRSLEEAHMLRACGADLLGFPLRLDFHQPDTSEAEARHIIEAVGAESSVLITYEEDPARLIDLCRFLNVRTLQIHSEASPDILALIKAGTKMRQTSGPRLSSGIQIIKSYVIGREILSPRQFVQEYSSTCDAFITDTFDPQTGASGATGKVHDWKISAELVQHSLRPIILAGGLTPANVRQAIIAVCPAAVDVHTGVERADGSKDPEMVRTFVREALAGFAEAMVG